VTSAILVVCYIKGPLLLSSWKPQADVLQATSVTVFLCYTSMKIISLTANKRLMLRMEE